MRVLLILFYLLFQDAPLSSAKGHQQSGGADGSGDGQHSGGGHHESTGGHVGHSTRPRSGTWSMANSRRGKIKAERDEEGGRWGIA